MDAKESLVVNIYNDLGSPAMKQVGSSVENLLKFVALPFKFLGLTAEQLEKIFLVYRSQSCIFFVNERQLMIIRTLSSKWERVRIYHFY